MLALSLLAVAAQSPTIPPPNVVSGGTLINSFETFDEIRQVSAVNAQVSTVEQDATEGKHALRVVFAPSEWPHVALTPSAPWNWTGVGAVSVDVTNPGKSPVSFGIRLDDDAAADGWLHSRTANGSVPAGQTERFVAVFAADPAAVGMRALPPYAGGVNAQARGGGDFNLGHVIGLQLFLHDPKEETLLDVDNVRTLPAQSLDGIVDEFGQYTGAEWPGKLHSATELASQRSAEEASLKKSPFLPDRDRFGGWASGPSLKATGFFRTEKKDGKWWFVDPDGRLFFSFGIDTMSPTAETTFVTGRPSMFRGLPSPASPLAKFLKQDSNVHLGPVKSGQAMDFYGANLYRKFGKSYAADWKSESLRRLSAWGFNTIGNWADTSLAPNAQVPYVATGGVYGGFARVSSGSDYWSEMPDPFDPRFAAAAELCLTPLATKVRGDSWCLGYFVDNELSWAGAGEAGRFGLAVGALAAPAGSPAKAAFVAQLRAKYGDIARLNGFWHSSFASWDDLEKPLTLNKTIFEAQRTDYARFVHAFARRYFETIRAVLQKLDPEHLYMGCRFAWHGPDAEEAAAEVCDVVSYNIYTPRLDEADWKHVAELGKPCIIGEFHFGALDRGMFSPGLVSAPDQVARAAMYVDYVSSVLRNPSFIGCHWFQYIDEPLTGRSYDGENYAIGFVSVTDAPYPELVAAARKVQGEGYRIRSKP